jgi:hypothetical protein
MTFEIRTKQDFESLNPADQEYVLEEIRETINEGVLISIQGEEFYKGELSLYGVYSMASEEEHDYLRSGGLWEYFNPNTLLATFTGAIA